MRLGRTKGGKAATRAQADAPRLVAPPGCSAAEALVGILRGEVIDELRASAEALNRGDPEPFASLFAESAEWRGISHGHLWWKRTPS
jgi:hypothetical protein